MPSVTQQHLSLQLQGSVNDYVTAIAWAPQERQVAVSSAVGEVQLLDLPTQQTRLLQTGEGQSVDCLAFSHDGQFLAAGGQDGRVQVWRMEPEQPQLLATLENARTWVDRLSWNPKRPELAFSLGRHAQVWNAATQAVEATLAFEASSVLDLAWRPQGDHLAVSGHQGVKIWNRQDWDADPETRLISAASMAIAWSPDGDYLASGNLDRTLIVWSWDNPYPWQMQGFPGKVRQLAWSDLTVGDAPLLASASMEGIVTWTKLSHDSEGWEAQVLDLHRERVNAIAFQPGTSLLASASEDGQVCLWQNAKQVMQILEGAPAGFSTVEWHPKGNLLAAGGQNGEWLIWAKSRRGQGFK